MIEILKKLKNRSFIIFTIEVLIVIGTYIYDSFIRDVSFEVFVALLTFVVVLNGVYLFLSFLSLDYKSKKNYLKIAKVIGNDTKQSYFFGQIGMITYDENKEVIWTSDLLEERNINIIGMKLLNWKSELEEIIEDDKKIMNITIDGRIYKCKHLKEIKVLIIQDITDYHNLSVSYKEEAPVLLNIVIDNYSEVAMLVEENSVLEMDSKVRTIISEWAEKYNVMIKRYRTDAYFCYCLEKDYQNILEDNFSVVDEVRKACETDENGFTLSIGVARAERDFNILSEMANNALDVALSRGGDQTVVSNSGQNMEFYGGKTEAKTKRHRVKIKVMSKSLMTIFENSSNVLIMGHRDADFDALGASLGAYAMVEATGKPVKIIYDDKLVELKTRTAFRQLYDKQTIDKMTVSPNKALELMDKDTLVVLVDVSQKMTSMAPNVVEKATKIVVIDHHRAAEKLDTQIFSYQESSASSASEIITEMIRYDDRKIVLSSEAATMMLTGILLDTNNYRYRTGTRTYDASMILKEYNADHALALEFLKDEYEEYILKNKIMSNATTPYYGVIVTTASEEDIIDRATLAKVAQEALYIKGIRTIFVIGRIGIDHVGISARSDGANNVALIMEKLGGGGHFSAAATQREDTTIEEVKNELLKVLEVYIGDSRIEQ